MANRFKAALDAFFKREVTASEKAAVDILGGRNVIWSGSGSPYFLDSKTTTLDNNTIVQACLGWITRNFPEPPSCIETITTEGKTEKDFEHPLVALLNRPEFGKMTSRRLWKATIGARFLDGNAYWEKSRAKTGPQELLYVPFSAVTPKAFKGIGGLSHYEVTLRDGRKRTIEPEDMIHFADGVDEQDPDLLKGLSALKSALRMVMADNHATAYAERVLRNVDGIGLAIYPKGDGIIQEADQKFLAAKLKSQFGGEGQGSTFVAGREIGIEHIGISPEKMMTRDLQRIFEERISAICGLPAICAGLGAGLDRSTFANMAEAREAATEQLLIPLWTETGDDLTIQLGPDFALKPNQKVARDLTQVAILQEDENKRWERLGKAFLNQGITRSEFREGLGYAVDETRDGIFYQDPLASTEDPQKALKREIMAQSRERRRIYDTLPEAPKNLPKQHTVVRDEHGVIVSVTTKEIDAN